MALNKIDFSLEAGDFVAVMGPSGSGKSSLGSLIAIGFCLSLNIGNTLEWEIPVSSVLHNSVTVAAFGGLYYSIIQY